MSDAATTASTDLAPLPLGEVLSRLAAKTPAPGGGAVAGAAGAIGAALGSMVVAYSKGKSTLADHDALHDESAAALSKFASVFLTLAAEDADAYSEVSRLQKLEKDDPDRVAGWAAAVEGAMAVPRATLASAAELSRLLEKLCGTTNRFLKSDLAIAAVLAECAARSAVWNVHANLTLIDDLAQRARLWGESATLGAEVRVRVAEIETRCAE